MKKQEAMGRSKASKIIFPAVMYCALLLAACANGINPDAGGDDDSSRASFIAAVDYTENGPELARFMGWQWAKEETDFKWIFKNDGTISVIHCCGELYENQFSYLVIGNILVTYGHETAADKLEASAITMTGDGASFTRRSGLTFVRGEPNADTEAGAPPLALKNDFTGQWRMDDGSVYRFSDQGEISVTASSGTDRYAYLIRENQLLTLGPLNDGTAAFLRQYRFQRSSGKITLRHASGDKSILTPLE
ncbi:MAG: hypothetical protein LBP23_10560 [Treponema sp.]|jgi:hypothetical protein|nr:hypothetical protein [Treponema sp.]